MPESSALLVAYLATYPATAWSVSSPSPSAVISRTSRGHPADLAVSGVLRGHGETSAHVLAHLVVRFLGRGVLDRVGQGTDGGPGGRGLVAAFGAVEADHCMEVDEAASLVFGDLGEGDPQCGVQGLLGHVEEGGQGASDVGGGPCP